MQFIKTYKNISQNNETLSFDIKKTEDIYQKTKGQPDEAHRHNYYTIILAQKAKGKHIIDFKAFDLKPKQVYFISPNQVHQVLEEEDTTGFVMTFSQQFLQTNGVEDCFIEDIYLFQDYGHSPPLDLDKEALSTLLGIARQVYSFQQSSKKFKYQAIGALLKLFLIHCNNLCTLSENDNTQEMQATQVLLKDFKVLLNKHYKAWHKVQDYAAALFVTTDYLNTAIKSFTGKTAKMYIQDKIIVEAKRMLHFSGQSTKEIAYVLGFSEPSNFSQFFKKCTGISPTQFIKSQYREE